MGQLRIVNKTGKLHDTHVYDVDTNEEIKYVRSVEIKGSIGEPLTILLEVLNPELDMVCDENADEHT